MLLKTQRQKYFCITFCMSCRSRSHITTDGQSVSQSVSMSRFRAHFGICDYILLLVWKLFSESCCLISVERPLWWEVGSVICLFQSSNLPVFTSCIFVTCVLQFSNLYTINIKLQSVPSEYSRLYCVSYFSSNIPKEARHLNGRINDRRQV
jgi:hypothetical protein